jgi:hypothetical protein
MRTRIVLSLITAAALVGPAAAQPAQRGGVRSETESRLVEGGDPNLVWNIIGLFGLLGLAGFLRGHPDDSYHPASME